MKLRTVVVLASLVLAVLWGCGKSADQKSAELKRGLEQADSLITAGEYQQAIENLVPLQGTAFDLRNDTAAASTVYLAGVAHRYLGDYDSALQSYLSAIERFHSLADKHHERAVRISLAELYAMLGRSTDALTIAADARTEAQLFGVPADRYRALMIQATCLRDLRRFDESNAVFEELLSIPSPEQFGGSRNAIYESKAMTAIASGNAADVADAIGRWRVAADQGRDNLGKATALYDYGNWCRLQGKFDSAHALYAQALQSLDASAAPELWSECWEAMGIASVMQRQYDKALESFRNGLSRGGPRQPAREKMMLQLGALGAESRQSMESNPEELLGRLQRVIDTCRALSLTRGVALGAYLCGTLAERSRDNARAIGYYREAQRLASEVSRPEADETDIAAAFLGGDPVGWSDPLLRLYAQENAVDSIFALADAVSSEDMARFMIGLALKTRDNELNARLNDVDWAYRAVTSAERDIDAALHLSNASQRAMRFTALSAALGRHRLRLQHAQDALLRQNQNFGRLLSSRGISLRDFRAALPAGAAAFECIPTDNALALLVIRGDTTLLRHTPVARPYFRSLLKDYLQLMGELRLNAYGLRMSEPAALQRINELSSVLYSLMIAPVWQDLRGVQKLYLLMPEECSWLPVHSLRGEGGALGQRLNVSYLPTGSALLMTAQPEHWTSTVLGLGYAGTTGWDVEYELKDIRSFFDRAGMLFDTSANLRRVSDSTYDLLHVAAEFRLDRNVPLNSHLVLSDGSPAHADENVPLGAMAGTAVPQTLLFSDIAAVPGQMHRYAPMLWLALGTRTVIATLWQGDRRAKKLFGERFYTALLAGAKATDAYAQAIQEMSKLPDANHIQRWGMYVQYGR